MYHYTESGLRNIWLANGYEEHETPYGRGVSFHNVEGLHRAIARGLINKAGKLTGAELRFLRKELGMSQPKLAEMLGNNEQTVAMWEKRSNQPKMADRFIRAIYREVSEGNAHIEEIITRLIDSDMDDGHEKITFEREGDDWKLAA
ncbi:MAG: helix-turn-helix domain-containing protein [Blastomonas sp.]